MMMMMILIIEVDINNRYNNTTNDELGNCTKGIRSSSIKLTP